ncbi:MAG: hypothetical protein A3D65_04265 [Candidatus Lloydbacteria bacterium RIFCSPHIGHO2_02_FULL_50_13]|uniref:Nudix hydrolase domain-containing protein n=1 Tax=Candidatus Lloydbacteria bacterium RIFCSPHIGHO2_02_FULL_50_13 TaxID=1798661 RepID=A0A1G2D4F2_9BACT|nr:MAG: hypothetical protein A3D65_04265 [Candidatus Lloydbacteria bacterium RIFCSPHIGHO2_02_FULL_50_13]
MTTQRNDKVVRTADVIAPYRGKLVLVKRLKTPFGLALPGGHVDPGETPKRTAVREFTEETGLTLRNVKFFAERKGKRRDPRYRMSKTRVYVGSATGKPKNERGHTKVVLMGIKKVRTLPKEHFAFDHWSILKKYFQECA